MPMKKRYAEAHMRAALVYGQLSYCKDKQVGCVIVKHDRVLSIGFNGTPPGWQNCCEDATGKTIPELYHAEANAVAKLARSSESGEGSSLFCTLAPCLNCAKLLVQAGINEVYYIEDHPKSVAGLQFLDRCHIPVYQMTATLQVPQQEQQGEQQCWLQLWNKLLAAISRLVHRKSNLQSKKNSKV